MKSVMSVLDRTLCRSFNDAQGREFFLDWKFLNKFHISGVKINCIEILEIVKSGENKPAWYCSYNWLLNFIVSEE